MGQWPHTHLFELDQTNITHGENAITYIVACIFIF